MTPSQDNASLIPADVLAAAKRVAYATEAAGNDHAAITSMTGVDFIASAILAERERCQSIAAQVDPSQIRGKSDRYMSIYGKARTDAAMAIASPASPKDMHQWQDISTAPQTGEFLAYGSYLYPGDKASTQYFCVVEPTGNPEFPFRDGDGDARVGVYSHWMPLPASPKEGE